MVSFWGPVIGAALFLLARDVIGSVTTGWMLWFGLLFMGVVLFKPEGIAGWWQDWRQKSTASGERGFARLRMMFGGGA
jgi:branched-chain amino acid transport system permease protein